MSSKGSPSKRPKMSTPLVNCTAATITFSQTFQNERYKIVEAPEDILRVVNSGGDLTLKGTEGVSDAVLCTSSKTYTLKKVETSNSVFLVPPSASDFEIVSKSSQFYEAITFVHIIRFIYHSNIDISYRS